MAGYSTDSVVQQTFTLLLSLIGDAPYFDDYVKSGRYSASRVFTDASRPFMELSGKTMGVVGMGSIGSKVAAVAAAFGMEVVYFSTSGTGHCKAYPSLPLDELLSRADVVSIHAPLNERTAGLIGGRELRLMKPSAVLLNLGRGGIVDETALAAAVDDGILAGAALDVYSREPLPPTARCCTSGIPRGSVSRRMSRGRAPNPSAALSARLPGTSASAGDQNRYPVLM